MNDKGQSRTIDDILQILPHRYPFLLVDRILDIREDGKIIGLKNVTANEPFFPGHFPGYPVMPGVLVIEAMAQVGGAYLMEIEPDRESKIVFFTAIDNARFRRQVRPGDQLRMEVTIVKRKGNICKLRGEAFVDGILAAEADLMAAVVKK
jgi:beta-hydroxyacyl-ACP dehydratase FabZ